MKTIQSTISLFLVVVILLGGAVAVSATENEVDWENYDWASYDWENFSTTDVSAKEWGSMCKWFRSEADLKLLFDISMKVDGYRSEGMGGVLFERFIRDPVGLIMALSLEEETVQTHVSSSIVYFGVYDPAEFEQFLNGLILPENAGAGARNILVQIVCVADGTRGMNITNPQTGDSISVAVLLMAASGLGLAVLLNRRKLLA